ncbi:MAG: hypothetical protein GY830_02915 [Bacteroidetes bacterium]|nr:hypothetical protein [Bacteroidota bacterium]
MLLLLFVVILLAPPSLATRPDNPRVLRDRAEAKARAEERERLAEEPAAEPDSPAPRRLKCSTHTAAGCVPEAEPEPEAETEPEPESGPEPEPGADGMSCDLAPIVSDLAEVEEKIDLIIEQAIHFNKVIKFGGVTSAAGLVLFIGYLLLLAILAVAKYVRNKRTEQEENNQRAIEKAAHTAARRLSKKSRKADSREDISLM